MKWMLAGAAVAVFTMGLGGAASASMCSTACDRAYTTCNAQNGGNAQPICMPKWMQCKKACSAPTKTTTTTVKPKR